MKARGPRPCVFIVFECLETPMKFMKLGFSKGPNLLTINTKTERPRKYSVFVFFCFIIIIIGVRAGGARGAAAPPKFGQLRFFGQQEKFGQSQFLKKFLCFFFSKRLIF